MDSLDYVVSFWLINCNKELHVLIENSSAPFRLEANMDHFVYLYSGNASKAIFCSKLTFYNAPHHVHDRFLALYLRFPGKFFLFLNTMENNTICVWVNLSARYLCRIENKTEDFVVPNAHKKLQKLMKIKLSFHWDLQVFRLSNTIKINLFYDW